MAKIIPYDIHSFEYYSVLKTYLASNDYLVRCKIYQESSLDFSKCVETEKTYFYSKNQSQLKEDLFWCEYLNQAKIKANKK